PGWVICGKFQGSLAVMDPAGAIYLKQGRDLDFLGTLEELMGIDLSTAPTPMVEIKIYSKSLPVGIALAYLLGLDELIRRLGAKVRRVLAGQRMQLERHEYAVRFKNESIIFDRNDRMAMLVMAGFNLYHAHIRNFDVELFNQKDVYAAVCERAGVASRYLRELDITDVLFVDPITEDLLKWMKEPTDFTGLLLRAVDLLKDEYVPSRNKDGDQLVEGLERVRGNE